MKRIILAIGMASLLCGCMSPGGLVIGPVSSMTAKQNERALIKRAAIASENLTADQKKKVIKATAHSTDAGEIAVSVGVDILALRGAKLTKQEIAKQALGAIGDALIYAAAAKVAEDQGWINLTGGDESSSRDISVDVSGSSGTTVNIDGDSQSTSTTTTHDNQTQY